MHRIEVKHHALLIVGTHAVTISKDRSGTGNLTRRIEVRSAPQNSSGPVPGYPATCIRTHTKKNRTLLPQHANKVRSFCFYFVYFVLFARFALAVSRAVKSISKFSRRCARKCQGRHRMVITETSEAVGVGSSTTSTQPSTTRDSRRPTLSPGNSTAAPLQAGQSPFHARPAPLLRAHSTSGSRSACHLVP